MSDLELDILTDDTAPNDTKADATKCTYCGCLKDGVLVFHCEICKGWVHASCLHSGSPSCVLGDNYYIFKCAPCNEIESFKRMKVTWVQVVSLSLYNLAQSSLGKNGYFKWKEDICLFIEKYWDLFFGNSKKRTPQWSCSVGSILSSGNPHRFQSGYGIFKDAGWWRLTDPTKSPAYEPGSPDNIVGTPIKPKRTYFGGSRSGSRKRSYFFSRAKQESLSFDENTECPSPLSLTRSSSPASSLSSVVNQTTEKPKSPKLKKLDSTLPLVAISDESDGEEIDTIQDDNLLETLADVKPKVDTNNSPKDESVKTNDEPKIVPMSLYEERKVLKKIINFSNPDLEVRRLKCKLLLRQKKRSLGIPVFNFDETATRLAMAEKGMILHDGINNNANAFRAPAVVSLHSRHHKILDRFLSTDSPLYSDHNDRTFKQKLIGCDNTEQQSIISPYTQRVLKPFIRRDYENMPRKLKLLQEIVAHYHKNDPEWVPAKPCPIDYTYVRPRHIPAVNALCRHFFWPGIDLSESLQFPDFSVVALYKKMVIGFGFLVPDMTFNEAYISFLFVHPDWQRASIGTFMLYHLIQTCMGKDVTLHVSASNLSMLLYQRFGFKPERFDADFYDKYMPPDSQECNHAFFMRLRR